MTNLLLAALVILLALAAPLTIKQATLHDILRHDEPGRYVLVTSGEFTKVLSL